MGVIKRKDVWYVKWKDASGKWRRQRTGARTKEQAKVIFAELVRQADRQRKGLEAHPIEMGHTLWTLCSWWLTHHCMKPSRRRCKSLFAVHVERTELKDLPLRSVSARVLGAYADKMAKAGYAPRSINLLKLNLQSVFTQARKAGLWAGENPATALASREIPKTPRPVFKPEEIEPLINAVHGTWRGFFATACYLGLRKGELCGLRKTDYDPVRRTLYVGRSYDADQTKGKRVDYLPVTEILAPYLAEALESPGAYLFPGPEGRARTEESAPEDILRAAMKRLGWIQGWVHKCRRCARKGREAAKKSWVYAQDDEPRWCEKNNCGFKLQPVAIPRQMVFHDLRHTAATHLLQAGVPVHHVQRILRHSSINTTIGTYSHLLTEDLRSALEKLGPRTVQALPLRAVKATK